MLQRNDKCLDKYGDLNLVICLTQGFNITSFLVEGRGILSWQALEGKVSCKVALIHSESNLRKYLMIKNM